MLEDYEISVAFKGFARYAYTLIRNQRAVRNILGFYNSPRVINYVYY